MLTVQTKLVFFLGFKGQGVENAKGAILLSPALLFFLNIPADNITVFRVYRYWRYVGLVFAPLWHALTWQKTFSTQSVLINWGLIPLPGKAFVLIFTSCWNPTTADSKSSRHSQLMSARHFSFFDSSLSLWISFSHILNQFNAFSALTIRGSALLLMVLGEVNSSHKHAVLSSRSTVSDRCSPLSPKYAWYSWREKLWRRHWKPQALCWLFNVFTTNTFSAKPVSNTCTHNTINHLLYLETY